MVATLKAPAYEDCELIKVVVQERAGGKHKRYFEGFRDSWIARVLEYVELAGNPESVKKSKIPKEEAGRFVNLYSSSKKDSAQYPIISGLRDKRLLYCPSCGEDGNPDTLDHYLPKDIYPEYSILTKNLTPMCFKCQIRKGVKVCDEHGKRIFFHPYFDEIQWPIFRVVIHPPYNAPTYFQVVICDDLPEEVAEVAARHLKDLGVFERFEDFCSEKYLHLLKMAATERAHGDVLSTFLPRILRNERKAINSWPAVFYRSVIEDKNLIEYLDNGVLPENIKI